MKGTRSILARILQFLCADVPLPAVAQVHCCDDGQILFQRMKFPPLARRHSVRRASEFCNERTTLILAGTR